MLNKRWRKRIIDTLHQWACHQNNDPDQPSTRRFDECVLPTLEICRSPHRKDYRETHDKQQKVHSYHLVEISSLSWDQEKVRNVKVLANTHSTKATKEVTG